MPRRPRLAVGGVPLHIIQRGNNRTACFFNDSDRRLYLEWLAEYASLSDCAIHAYVLMTNHVHLLLTPQQSDSAALLMRRQGQRYAQYVNRTYQRSGTLWEGRYRSCIAQDERYVLACYRYIEMNPVRANMVEHPAEYPWSSYLVNAGGKLSDLVTLHKSYFHLGATAAERQFAYRALFDSGLSDETLAEIRDAANKGWALGSPWFLQRIEAMLARPVRRQGRGGDRKSADYRKTERVNRN